MKPREHLAALWRYVLARFGEASTYKGLLTMLASTAGLLSLPELKLEHLTTPQVIEAASWGGLFLVGAINAAFPQDTLYRTDGK